MLFKYKISSFFRRKWSLKKAHLFSFEAWVGIRAESLAWQVAYLMLDGRLRLNKRYKTKEATKLISYFRWARPRRRVRGATWRTASTAYWRRRRARNKNPGSPRRRAHPGSLSSTITEGATCPCVTATPWPGAMTATTRGWSCQPSRCHVTPYSRLRFYLDLFIYLYVKYNT